MRAKQGVSRGIFPYTYTNHCENAHIDPWPTKYILTRFYIGKVYLSVDLYLYLTHKKIKNMSESFIVYNDSAILNRPSEFPATLLKTEIRIFTYILNVKQL